MQTPINQELACCVCGVSLWSFGKEKRDRYFLYKKDRYWCDQGHYWQWVDRKIRKTMELFGSEFDCEPMPGFKCHSSLWDSINNTLIAISFPRYNWVKVAQTCDTCGKIFSKGYLHLKLNRKRGNGWYQPHDRWCSKKCHAYYRAYRFNAVSLSSKIRHWKTVPAALVETKMIVNRTKQLCQK